MKKKEKIGITLTLALALGISVIAYAATGNFTMTYLPGTSDTVTNMPASDTGTNGEAYSVSATIPQREGYEFLGWELDYEIATSYTVKYLKEGTENEMLIKSKSVPDQKVGTTITETAVNIPGYNLIGEASQSKALVANAEDNIITFYYAERPAVDYGPNSGPILTDYATEEPYIVHHINKSTLEELATDYGTAMAGESLTVYARDSFDNLTSSGSPEQTLETVPINHTLEYQDFRVSDNGWYRIIPGNNSNLQIDELQQRVAVAQKGDTYVIWTLNERTKEEQRAIYESFRTNVYGMSDAEYANCLFISGNGASLNGFTVGNGSISLDEPTDWSIAIGFYLPSYEEIYEKGDAPLEFTFYYEQTQTVSYIVKYIDIETLNPVAEDKTVSGLRIGDYVEEKPIPVEGYIALDEAFRWHISKDGEVKIFIYYYFGDHGNIG